jgi:hypothetical protein
MSPPKLDVKNLGADGQILGHDVHHSVLTMTQSCTDKQTGDVCDFQFGFDLWLTSDKIAGLEDRAAFEKAYVTKMGLIGDDAIVSQQQVQQALAPYAEQMRQLRAKAGDIKGQSLRTVFALSTGGPHCGSANKGKADSGSSDTPVSGGGVPTSLSDVGTKLLGSMFAKKKKADDAAAAAAETHKAEPLAAGMISVVKFSTETTAIRTDSVPATQFEIPADWTKVLPKDKGKPDAFECPKNAKND